jgi:hypothetical protein
MFQPGDIVKDEQGALGYVRKVKVKDFSTDVDVYYFGDHPGEWGRYNSSELILIARGNKK